MRFDRKLPLCVYTQINDVISIFVERNENKTIKLQKKWNVQFPHFIAIYVLCV
jgi:hypothetical protein